MPRRYSDYPDAYFLWNLISRVGSGVTTVSVIYFIIILWEGFVRLRPALCVKAASSSLELTHRLPPLTHRYPGCPTLQVL